jgi:hypothetical protein
MELLEQVQAVLETTLLPASQGDRDEGYVVETWGATAVSVRWQRQDMENQTNVLPPSELEVCRQALLRAGLEAHISDGTDSVTRVIVQAS